MILEPQWIRWARELQALAQTGSHFATSDYDRERYHRISEIAAEIFAKQGDIEGSKIRTIFAAQSGYATPKVDVRAAVFRDRKVLLVQERSDGLWTLPGGWADVNDSPSEAVEKEVVQESGFKVRAQTRLFHFIFISCSSSARLRVERRHRRQRRPASSFLRWSPYRLCRCRGSQMTRSGFALMPG